MIEVTTRDTETGESETITMHDDYVLVTAGECYLAHTQTFRNGTHVLIVKKRAHCPHHPTERLDINAECTSARTRRRPDDHRQSRVLAPVERASPL